MALLRRHKQFAIWSIFALLILSVSLLYMPDMAFAQEIQGPTTQDFGVSQFEDEVILSDTDIRVIIARIINVFLSILGIITVGIFLYAGYMWMTSGGDESKIASARKTMINAVIGLIIIMSAFIIVQFVLNALRDATGLGGRGNNANVAAQFDSFLGSGGLGSVIQDHYPFRDQEGVARNTKIVVTFRDPIDVASILQGNDPQPVDPSVRLGECLVSDDFDWAVNCNQLDGDVIQIFELPAGGTEAEMREQCNDPVAFVPSELVAAAVAVSYEGDDVRTVVFRPLEFIGNSIEDTQYCVRITEGVQKKNDAGTIFDRAPGPYTWKFGVSTELDLTPPRVQRTVPQDRGTVFRNNITSITFDEPVDPTVTQGSLTAAIGSFEHILFGELADDTIVTGTWKITNGYRTVEFLPNLPCGSNSCGDVMYCLPVNSACDPDDTSCLTTFNALVRTAAVINGWESLPFTGVADMAGNALDSAPFDQRDGKPTVATPSYTVDGPAEYAPDNYHFAFGVRNEIDFSIPYVQAIDPAVDQENVRGDVPLTMTFSHVMWLSTLGSLKLLEEGELPPGETLASPWQVPRSDVIGPPGSEQTETTLLHREFGPNELDLFYFMEVPGDVKANNQNCLYPGRGPGVAGTDVHALGNNCYYEDLGDGTAIAEGCVPVDPQESADDTGCAHNGDQTAASIAACEDELRRASGLN